VASQKKVRFAGIRAREISPTREPKTPDDMKNSAVSWIRDVACPKLWFEPRRWAEERRRHFMVVAIVGRMTRAQLIIHISPVQSHDVHH
jgi:hypothetical protein